MQCVYCRFDNSPDEHRCRRCGRRLVTGPARPAPEPYLIAAPSRSFTTATATAPAQYELAGSPSRVSTVEQPVPPVPVTGRQQGLFADPDASRVIEFPSRRPANRMAPESRPASSRRPAPPSGQASLNFAAPRASAEAAVIYCDAPVATLPHRALACGLDVGMALIGFGFFLLSFHLLGGQLVFTLQTLPWYAGSFLTLLLFYSFLWALTGRETPGARWLGLKLIDFDGFPISRHDRLVRFAAAGLSFASAGLGVVWALADEENLTWHDHISKTFPTFRNRT